jgi:hypothetical protein
MVTQTELDSKNRLELRLASSLLELLLKFEVYWFWMLQKGFPLELQMGLMFRYLENRGVWRSIRSWSSAVELMP